MTKGEIYMRTLLLMTALFFCGICFGTDFPAIHTVRGELDKMSGHLQGACASQDAFYFGHQKGIFKLTRDGKFIKHVSAPPHSGDVCYYKGKVYSAVAYYDKARLGKGCINEYDADLNLLRTYELEVSTDGITVLNDKIYFGAGPTQQKLHRGNRIGVIPVDFKGKPEFFDIDHGYPTHFGVQCIATDGKLLFMSFYCHEYGVGVFTPDLKPVGVIKFTSSIGFGDFPQNKTADTVFFRVRQKYNYKKKEKPYFIITFHKYRNGKMINLSSKENKK